MQYTFLKCSTCTQKPCQSSQWHRKCTFIPLNVLSTSIPFGIRNGIINPCFQTLQVLPSYSVFNNLFWTLPNLKPNKPQLIPNYNSLKTMSMTTSNCIRVKKDLTKDKYLQIQFYDGVFGNIKTKQNKKGFDLKTWFGISTRIHHSTRHIPTKNQRKTRTTRSN